MQKNERNIEFGFLENSHRFLKEAVVKAKLAGSDEDQWMFAVSALIQSVELALKAALAEIHPILIYENIDAPKRTVSIQTATNRLTSIQIGRLTFTDRDQKRLLRATNIRNQLTHSGFSMNLNQIEANFHEVFAFLAEFNRRSFSVTIDDIIDQSYLIEFLRRKKHYKEMLSRALTRIEEEEIEFHLIRSCSKCAESTFVQADRYRTCYLCHHRETWDRCENCGEVFLEEELEDVSDEFITVDYEYQLVCATCALEIKQTIYEEESQLYNDQLLNDEYEEARIFGKIR